MTDNLRTRIAAVLPKIFDRIADGELVEWGDMADAVIRELGLQREKNLPLGDERFHQPMHRYVTEWTADE